MSELMEAISAEPCTCVSCGSCGGRGYYYIDHRGRYLGSNRSDDMDESEHCEECGGGGITEVCGRCEYLAELDHEEEW